MCFFPEVYAKPVLTGIVDAAGNGWNAKCASGGTPTTGWSVCTNGPNVDHTQPTCPGHGGGASNNRLYGGGGSSRVLNPGDISQGL